MQLHPAKCATAAALPPVHAPIAAAAHELLHLMQSLPAGAVTLSVGCQ
jgi:hypothetical protein